MIPLRCPLKGISNLCLISQSATALAARMPARSSAVACLCALVPAVSRSLSREQTLHHLLTHALPFPFTTSPMAHFFPGFSPTLLQQNMLLSHRSVEEGQGALINVRKLNRRLSHCLSRFPWFPLACFHIVSVLQTPPHYEEVSTGGGGVPPFTELYIIL